MKLFRMLAFLFWVAVALLALVPPKPALVMLGLVTALTVAFNVFTSWRIWWERQW